MILSKFDRFMNGKIRPTGENFHFPMQHRTTSAS